MFMRLAVLLLLVVSTPAVFGQAIIKEIIDYTRDSTHTRYVFPMVVMPAKKSIADKINRQLQSSFLDTDSVPSVSIFENVWRNEQNSMPMLSDITYKVNNNSPKILSLALSAEGCGAYCEDYTSYYNFNLVTGKLISLPKLFTKNGQKILLEYIALKKGQALGKQLYEIKLIKNDEKLPEEDRQRCDEMMDLYINCFENTTSLKFDYVEFYITNTTINIELARCSIHALRAIDELGEFHITIDLRLWYSLLSEYGKRLVVKK